MQSAKFLYSEMLSLAYHGLFAPDSGSGISRSRRNPNKKRRVPNKKRLAQKAARKRQRSKRR